MNLKILTGNNLTQEQYLKTWELDNSVFKKKDQLSKETAINWFNWSNHSTICLWDMDSNNLIGYITPFLFNHKFATSYINSAKSYKQAIKKDCFENLQTAKTADIYIFSTAIKPEFRDKVLLTNGPFKAQTAFKILNEAFVDWICEVKNSGISINYIFGERVSDSGEKYLRSLNMQPCSFLKNEVKYAKIFSPSMFQKCSNVGKLYDLYKQDNWQKPFDKSLLNGHEYLSIKNNVLYYKDINLLELVNKYKAPLEVAYTPIIAEKVKFLKNLFKEKIAKYNYGAEYKYAYATKANYYSEVVLSALQEVDMLETSSSYDIGIIHYLAQKKIIKPGFTVICNGFKNERYIEYLKKLLDLKINVIPVIENERELDIISSLKNYKINIGIRYNSDFEARIIKNNFDHEEELDNRFGFDKENVAKIAKTIQSYKNFTFKLLHFHFGGTITNIDNYIKAFGNIMDFYCTLKKQFKSLEYFDFGGGLPVKYSITYDFDYNYLVDKMVYTAKFVCDKYKIAYPNLIGEHGRFTAADHSFYIYKIDFSKTTNNKNWYIINGSLMNMTPDIWGIQQDFTILPVNLYENKCVPVCLGGETCDPDDRYFLNDKNIKLFMPQIKKGQTLYIAIFSIGAYQEIISGIGGLHHCLIPEGNELIIYKKGDKSYFIQSASVTDNKKTLDVLDYDKENYIKHFIKP